MDMTDRTALSAWTTEEQDDWYPADDSMHMYRFEYDIHTKRTTIDPGFYEDIENHLEGSQGQRENTVTMHPEDSFKLNRLQELFLPQRTNQFCLKIRLRIPRDVYRSYPCIARFSCDDCGAVRRVIGFVLCIHNYWHLQSQAIQLEKAYNTATLATGAVHDTKNHLHITGNSLAMLRAMTQQEQGAKLIQMAEESTAEAAAILEQVLDYTREHPPSLRRINLHDMLAQTIQAFTFLFNARYAFVCNGCDEPCEIDADPAAIRNVFINLVINARDAMPRGGTLTFTLSRSDHNPAWRGDPKRAWIMVSIRDTGTGMAPEVVRQAFHPFFTTKPEGKGTGIGLWMCHTTMTNHEGTITIHSRPGEGTEVVLAFPEARQPVASPPQQ